MATTVKEVNAAVRKVSTGEDIRQEMLLVLGPHANWEEYLYPAPLTILLLGDLMLVSTEQDFNISKKQPKGGFKYIKWPDSFRASLSQVSNSGWSAFNTAHKNMDKIRLLTADVPNCMKDVLETLAKGTPDDIRDLLPIYVGQIKHCSQQCLQLAKGAEKDFSDVMCLAHEILEACVSAKSGYEDQLQDTKVKLTVEENRQKEAERQKEFTLKQYKRMEKAVDKAEKSYTEAVDAMPTAWETIGMQFVEGITQNVTNVLSGAASMVTRFQFGMGDRNEKTVAEMAKSPPKNEEQIINNVRCYSVGDEVKSLIDILAVRMTEAGGAEKLEIIRMTRFKLEGIIKDLTDINKNPVKSRLVLICERGIKVCKDKKAELKSMQSPKDQGKAATAELESLVDDVHAFTSAGKMYIRVNPTEMKPPGQAKMASSDAKSSSSTMQQALQNARSKVDATTKHLEMSREQYEKAAEKQENACTKLLNIMNERSKLDLEKIDFENIRKILIRGIKTLGEMAEKWQKLIMFFQMMSNIVECCLNKNMSSFLQQTQSAEQLGYSLTKFRKDMIYKQAFEASKIAYLVNMISGTYVQVSGMYIMDRIAGLNKLLGFDPKTEKGAIQRERQKLVNGCMEAQKGIKSLIIAKKTEFDHQVKKRIRKLEMDLKAALPPPTREEQRALDKRRKAITCAVTELQGEAADHSGDGDHLADFL